MRRTTPTLLGAFLTLAGCKQSPSPTAQPLPAPAALEARQLPSAAPARDAGALAAVQAAPAPKAPTLGLAHVDRGTVNHLAQARTLQEEGEAPEALADARRQLADVPDDEDAMDFVARTARALGQNALAAAAYESLGSLREDDAAPLVQAARVHLVLADGPSAARLARAALGRDEENVEAYQVLGRAALLAGDLRAAIDALEQARALDPAHGWVLNNLGFAYLRANQNADALEALSRAAELLPAVAVVQNNLGVALERLGRAEEATAAFERSATLAPHYTRAQVNRARLALLRTSDAGTESEPEADQDTDASAAEVAK